LLLNLPLYVPKHLQTITRGFVLAYATNAQAPMESMDSFVLSCAVVEAKLPSLYQDFRGSTEKYDEIHALG